MKEKKRSEKGIALEEAIDSLSLMNLLLFYKKECFNSSKTNTEARTIFLEKLKQTFQIKNEGNFFHFKVHEIAFNGCFVEKNVDFFCYINNRPAFIYKNERGNIIEELEPVKSLLKDKDKIHKKDFECMYT